MELGLFINPINSTEPVFQQRNGGTIPGSGMALSWWGCARTATDVVLDLQLSTGSAVKRGGLVGIRHADVRDEAGTLAAMALTTSKVSYKPTIHYGKGVTVSQPTQTQLTGRNAPRDEAHPWAM